jgi:hypothetical protein
MIQRYGIQVCGTDMGYNLIDGHSFCESEDVKKLEQELEGDIKVIEQLRETVLGQQSKIEKLEQLNAEMIENNRR